MDIKRSKNILIANPFGIGDVLFSTPLIRAFKERNPDAFIGYLCNRRAEPLLSANPDINEVFVYEKDDMKKLWGESKLSCVKEFLKLLLRIKKRKFDVLIDLSLAHQYSLMSSIVGIRTRIGFNYKNRGRFLTHKINIEGYNSKHIVDYYLSLSKLLGIDPPETGRLRFFVNAVDVNRARCFLNRKGIKEDNLVIGVIPGGGTSWGNKAGYKHWPEEKFAALIDKLSKEFSAQVIIFGDQTEKNKCANISHLSNSSPVSACAKTTLRELAAFLKFCDLAIANDGGPLHIAVSQDIPTVSIFGPVDEKVYGPYPPSENNIVIKNNIECRPCYKKFKVPECNNRICTDEIAVDTVFDAVRTVLKRIPAKRKELDVRAVMKSKTNVSVVVLTKNEEANIADCLDSVWWADEVIVVDDFSADQTREIASKFTDMVFKKKMEVEGTHRNWAYSQAKHRWVLSLDADEMASDGLRDEMSKIMEGSIDVSAFSIPLRNYIGSYWVRYGGWYPAGKVRFFDKYKFKYEESSVHPRVFIDGKCGHLKGDIIHKGYPDFGHFMDSLNRQTTLEAEKWVEDKRKMSFARALRKANDRFFKTYLLKRGYKDGIVGFMVAFFAYLYQIMSYAKYWELKRRGASK